jgi:hypothetical protein
MFLFRRWWTAITSLHPSHSQAHGDFTAPRLLRDAFAARLPLGDPRVVPCLRRAFLPGHAALCDRGESIGCSGSVPSPMTLAFAESQATRHPRVSIIRFRWVNVFAASLVRCSLRPVELLALANLAGHSAQPTGTFTGSFRRVGHPFRRGV